MIWYEQLPALLVLAGAMLLTAALASARSLGRALFSGHAAGRTLFGLIAFFIAGYVSYAWLLNGRVPEPTEYVATVIMLAGGIFVLM